MTALTPCVCGVDVTEATILAHWPHMARVVKAAEKLLPALGAQKIKRRKPAVESTGKTPRAPRPRDPAFDALATLHGGADKLTPPMARTVGAAIAAIRRATPNVDPREVDRRAQNYRRLSWNESHRWPSAQALAKWWPDCDMPDLTVAAAPRNRTVGDLSDAELAEGMR